MVTRNEFSGAVMSVDELLKAVDDLSEPDFEKEINRGIPAELSDRYAILADKRDDETLTAAEYQELLDIAQQIEAFGVKRLEALAKLAELRQVPLLQLMTDLGIKAPAIR